MDEELLAEIETTLALSLFDIISEEAFDLTLPEFENYITTNRDNLPPYLYNTVLDYINFSEMLSPDENERISRFIFLSSAHTFHQRMTKEILYGVNDALCETETHFI